MKSRFGLYLPFIVLAALSVIWSGLWYYNASRTEAVLTDILVKEAANGREWTCPNRHISGFPFRISVSCDAPSFLSKIEGHQGAGSLQGLRVEARVSDPTRAIATLQSPLKLNANGQSLEINWADAHLSLSGSEGKLNDFIFDMNKITVAVQASNSAPILGGAQRVNVNLAQDAADSPLTAPFKLLAKIEGVTFAPLDALSANTQPLNIELQTRATHVPLKPLFDWRKMLDTWREQGGSVSIALFNFDKGAIHLDAKGDLSIDDSHKLSGKLDTHFKGLSQLMAQFGAGGLSAMGSGGALPIVFNNGKLRVGPVPVGGLQPIY